LSTLSIATDIWATNFSALTPAKEIMAGDSKTARAFCGRLLREFIRLPPGLKIGVRVSAFDTVPFRPDPELSSPKRLGPGIPEPHQDLLTYRWGFGLNPQDPTQSDFGEAVQFLTLLEQLGISLVNLTAGSLYYNPHLQRPALFPPSDGYQPPRDPLVDVAWQLGAVRDFKPQFPKLMIVGTGYSYLQDFLPYVAPAVVREAWVDFVGLARVSGLSSNNVITPDTSRSYKQL
jgi:hypothetical protein